MQPRISVVVVNYNRPHEVKDAIQSLLSQSAEPFEIIIIDDASNPPLSLAVDDLKMILIRFDKEVGLSAARNHGISIAKGDYIAFIDDDCIVSEHWIEEIQNGINAGGEILGGPLRPLFKAKPPKWWNENELGYFVGVGNSKSRKIWGANMVFKKEVFQKIGVFNPNIGRQKGKLLGFEDARLISKGEKSCRILFLPKAEVLHLVGAQRLTLKYIIRWSFNHGKSLRIDAGTKMLILMRWRVGAFFYLLKAIIKFIDPFTKSTQASKVLQVAIMTESIGIII
jgi:glucosyl-dolichyl phosphate glucuronosyltransferase